MKKSLAAICIVMALILCTSAVSFAEDIDLSVYSVAELNALSRRISDELANRQRSNPSTEVIQQSTDKEILFQSIPWNSNINTVMNALVDKGLLPVRTTKKGPRSLEAWSLDFYGGKYYSDAGMSVSEWSPDEARIAGYQVLEVDAFCYYQYSTEGGVDYDETKTHFYRANVYLKPIDYDYAEIDLTNKLSTLYGTPVDISNSGKSWHVWYGANNTAVYLFHSVSGSGENRSDTMWLVYGLTDSIIPLTEIDEINMDAKRQLERNNSDNMDGL